MCDRTRPLSVAGTIETCHGSKEQSRMLTHIARTPSRQGRISRRPPAKEKCPDDPTFRSRQIVLQGAATLISWFAHELRMAPARLLDVVVGRIA